MVTTFVGVTAVYTVFLVIAIVLMAYRLGQLREYFTDQAFQAGFNTGRRTRSWSITMVDGKPALHMWSDNDGDMKIAMTHLRRQMAGPDIPKPTFRDEPLPLD